jgi:hypothetical protein
MAENKEYPTGASALITKWGNEVFDDGVMNAPQCIARYGNRFLSGGELSFIMCLMSYKYDNRNPFPSQEQIAKDMGVQLRQVERWVSSLFNNKGLINIYERYLENGVRTSNEYDFAPLLEKCLEESRKEKAKNQPKVKKTKRERSKPKAEKTVEIIPPTKCTGTKETDEMYPRQNVRVDDAKMYGWDQSKCTDGSRQNVGANKEKFNKENINNVIDDEGLSPLDNKISFNKIAKLEFEERFQDVFDRDMFQAIYEYSESIGVDFFTADEAERQYRFMLDIKGEENVGDYPTYFVNGIVRNRKSKKSAITKRKLKQAGEQAKNEVKQEQQETHKPVPFYNWLDSGSENKKKAKKGINSSYTQTDASKLKFKDYEGRPTFDDVDIDEDLPF